jgi:large subunit ribosomal protein L13
MKKTYSVSEKEVKQDWHVIDAKDVVLGRLATNVAVLLTGKNKTNYTTHINMGDKVIVINAEKVAVTGKKAQTKMYYRHSGYPGGFREENFESLIERKPEDVVRFAVSGMLPNNKLRAVRMANLYIYKGEEHPHKGQVGK